mmetsp:Transcript_10939/g.30228  ORF Transcript_10939/g.30228 Transcript_10939/m.30228 type:complete len:243 (+) Transcript_10939:219-947(+)
MWRSKGTQLLSRIRSAVSQKQSQASEAVKAAVSQQVDAAKTNLTKQLQEQQKKVFESYKQSSQALSKQASEKYIPQAQKLAKEQSQRALKTAQQTLSDASQAGKASTRAAWNATSQTVQQTQQNVTNSARQNASRWMDLAQYGGRRALRYAFWWSLAIVGVYGVATTLPKELIKYALQGNDDKSGAKTTAEDPSTVSTVAQTIQQVGTKWMADVQGGGQGEGEQKPDEGSSSPSSVEKKWWA